MARSAAPAVQPWLLRNVAYCPLLLHRRGPRTRLPLLCAVPHTLAASAVAAAAAVKSLQFPAATDPSNPVKLSTGLHRAPLSAGVKNATLRYDLPSPAVAVRNLVRFVACCSQRGSGAARGRVGWGSGGAERALDVG